MKIWCLSIVCFIVSVGVIFETNHEIVFVPFLLSGTILIAVFAIASIRNKQFPVNFIWNIHKYAGIEFNENEKKESG